MQKVVGLITPSGQQIFMPLLLVTKLHMSQVLKVGMFHNYYTGLSSASEACEW